MRYSQPTALAVHKDMHQYPHIIFDAAVDANTLELPLIALTHYMEHTHGASRVILIAGSDVPPRGDDRLAYYQAIMESFNKLSEEALQRATRNIPAITATSIFNDQRGTEAHKRQFRRLLTRRKRQTHVGAHRTAQDQSTRTTLTYTMVTFLLVSSSLGVLCLTIALW